MLIDLRWANRLFGFFFSLSLVFSGDCCWCCCNINFFQTIILACVQCFRMVFVMEYSEAVPVHLITSHRVYFPQYLQNSIDQSVFFVNHVMNHCEPKSDINCYCLWRLIFFPFLLPDWRLSCFSLVHPRLERKIYITIVWVLIEALTIIQASNPIDEIMSFHRVKHTNSSNTYFSSTDGDFDALLWYKINHGCVFLRKTCLRPPFQSHRKVAEYIDLNT